MAALIVGIGVLALVYAVLAVIGWRRPLLARLGWREATRRPGQSALLIVGMMFGTAAILAMQSVADTLIQSTNNSIYNQWGRIDITVSANGRDFSEAVARSLAADPGLSGKTAGVQGGLDLGGSAADLDSRLTSAPIQIVGFDNTQAGLGRFTLSDGRSMDGRSLTSDQAILSPSLGTHLEAKAGDHIRIEFVLEGQQRQIDLVVAGVAELAGSGGYGLQPGIFVPMTAFQAFGIVDSINVVRISAPGDGQAEVDNAHRLAPAVEAAVSRMDVVGMSIREVKRDDLAFVNEGNLLGRVFTGTLSLIVVLAATALVVNLVLALAEERRPRLAVLRAIGLTRTGLITVSMLEGAVYALAAGVLGVIPGVAYAYFVDNRPLPQGVLDQTGGHLFTITAATVAFSVCVGVLITLLTILLASLRTSRMAISSAIRDLPEPAPPGRRSWLGIAGPAALAVLAMAAWLLGDLTLRMLGGAALVVAVSMLLKRRISERARATLGGLVLVLWAVGAVVTASLRESVLNDPLPTLVGLLLIVFGSATMLSANLRLLERALRLGSNNLATSLRPSLAYLTRRPVRSGLATGTFALVLSILVFLDVLLPTGELAADAATGGYDVRVTALGAAAFAVPSDLASQVSRIATIDTRAYLGPMQADTGGPSGWHSAFVQFYPLTDAQLATPPVKLVTRDPRYSSDAAAWQAVKADPHLVVAAQGNNGSNQLGRVWFKTSAGDAELKIVGVVQGGVLSGYIGTQQTFSPIASSGVGTTVLLGLAPGVDAHTFTTRLRQETFGQAVDATATRDLVDAYNHQGDWWVGFFTLLMQTAVVVGVLSLGILALRAAVERRRTIGVLRALGYQPGQVLGGLLTEAVLTAMLGILVGIGAGLSVPVAAVSVAGSTQLRVDVGQVVITAAVALFAVICVTIGPAARASRLPISVALRTVG